jgi:hypothetical protein
MSSPDEAPDDQAQIPPPFNHEDETADDMHDNEDPKDQTQKPDIVRQDGEDDLALTSEPPPLNIVPGGFEVIQPYVRHISPSSNLRMGRFPPGILRNHTHAFPSGSLPSLGAVVEEKAPDIDYKTSRAGKSDGRNLYEPTKNSRFFGDPGNLQRLTQSTTDLSTRIQELENRCCEGHSDRTSASANVLQEEFIRQITAIFEDQNQSFAAFQGNLEETVTRAGNSLMDCAEQQIQAVQDSATQAIQSLVNNGGCPCLSKPGEYTQPSLTSEILAQPQGSTSKSASPGHSEGSHGQSGGERRNDIHEAGEAFDGDVPDQRFEERRFNQRLQRNRINNMSEVAAWDDIGSRQGVNNCI